MKSTHTLIGRAQFNFTLFATNHLFSDSRSGVLNLIEMTTHITVVVTYIFSFLRGVAYQTRYIAEI